MTSDAKKRVKFGPFEADLATGELWKSGLRQKLGGQPFEILATLLARPGELVAREELQKKIWPADTVVDFSHGLNAAVNKLRDALADDSEAPRYIETMPRRGYRYIGPPVELASAPSAPALSPGPGVPAQNHEPVLAATSTSSDVSVAGRVPARAGIIDGNPLPSQPPSLDTRPRSTSRILLRYAAAGLALVFIGIICVVAYKGWENARNEALERQQKELMIRSEILRAQTSEIHKPEKLEIAKKAKERREYATEVPPRVGSPGIWQTQLARSEDGVAARKLIVALQGRTEGPQPSPDGKKLAFMSDRTGALEIWISDADGSNARQLTHLGACGSPQWSPDGRWIAFDAYGGSGSRVYVVSAVGEPVLAPIEANMESFVPRWSRDGKWIYFAGTGSGEAQVWKLALAGGPAMQMTRNGGFAAYESYDGKMLYYAKTREEYPEVWEMPVSGGSEKPVSPLLRPGTWANWAVTETGILFLNRDAEDTFSVEFYDFATRGVRPLTSLHNPSFWLAASREGRSIWYGQ